MAATVLIVYVLANDAPFLLVEGAMAENAVSVCETIENEPERSIM
jgi:hypothetical protein